MKIDNELREIIYEKAQSLMLTNAEIEYAISTITKEEIDNGRVFDCLYRKRKQLDNKWKMLDLVNEFAL